MEDMNRFTVLAKFSELFIKTTTISTGVVRLLLDDFLSKYMFNQTNFEEWFRENKEALLDIYRKIHNVLKNTIERFNSNQKIPNLKAPLTQLFEFNMFSVIRSKAYDKEGNIRNDIPKNELEMILKSYYNACEDLDYNDLSLLLGQYKKFVCDDNSKKIYLNGIKKELYYYDFLWYHNKDIRNDTTYFFRYQLASYHYEYGNIEFVCDFLMQFDDLKIPEKILLADSLGDLGKNEEASLQYLNVITEYQNLRVIINTFNALILSNKISEAMLFEIYYSKDLMENFAFKNNQKLLKKKVIKLKPKEESCLKNFSEVSEKDRENFCKFSFNNNIEECTMDQIIEIFAKQNGIPIYNSKLNSYYISKEHLTKDCFKFFIQKPKLY